MLTMGIQRHETVALHSGASAADFESFVTGELIPFFSEHFKGPTRASIADIKGQSFANDVKHKGHYLWVTEWDGNSDVLLGKTFEGARMIGVDGLADILKKLESFGSRSAATVFDEFANVVVGTNV
jgi:hypothetical protein